MSARVAGSKNLSEDWLSVWIDLGVFALALGLLAGYSAIRRSTAS
jgi:hypothetical protein